MPRHEGSEEQDVLLSHNNHSSLELDGPSQPCTASNYTSRSNFACALSQYYLLGCLAFIVLSDLIFVSYIARVFKTEYYNDKDLPLANPYIGLQELYSSGNVESKILEPILNRPHIVMQVSYNYPDRAGRRGEHRVHVAIMGELSPLDKHFVVDGETHTVVQFRAMDFGMEECSLMLSLPGPADRFIGEEAPHFSNTTLLLRICTIDVSSFLDVESVTWKSRPNCASPWTAFHAQVGTTTEVFQRFPCAWGTYHSFELACANEDNDSTCMADVWSNHNQTWGLYMYQHQTV